MLYAITKSAEMKREKFDWAGSVAMSHVFDDRIDVLLLLSILPCCKSKRSTSQAGQMRLVETVVTA
jgi:hypothetical protein